MKNLFKVILVSLILFFAPPAFAVGTATVTSQRHTIANVMSRIIITIAWTADGSGNVTSTISAGTYGFGGYYLLKARTYPSSPAPTAYSVVLNRTYGALTIDIAWNLLATRSTTVVEDVLLATSTHLYDPVDGDIALSISGAGSGGKGVLILWFSAE